MQRTIFDRLRALVARVSSFVRRERIDDRLAEELRFHVEMSAEAAGRRGVPRDDAYRLAVARLGGQRQWHEAARDDLRGAALDDFRRDVWFACRTLAASPAFTLAAVATLALGIGANTAIFSVVDGVLLKPLPFSSPQRLVRIYQNDPKKGRFRDEVAPGNFAEWQKRTSAFAAMAVAEPFGAVYRAAQSVEEIRTFNVTRDFFSILDERPLLGRVFEPADYVRGGAPVVVLTYASWRTRFGGDPAIVGSHIILDDVPTTVVGVLPRDFTYLGTRTPQEMYAPKVLDSIEINLHGNGWYNAVARLAPGVSIAQANADLGRATAQLAREFPATNGDLGATVTSIRDGVVGDTARALTLLLGAVGFVLLIACTNVANLMLTRTARRGREFALRMALGAERGRIVRQVITESFVLAAIGGVAGAMLAYWSIGPVRAMTPPTVPRADEMRVDARALVFTLLAVVATTLAAGLAPAFRAARSDAAREIKAGGRAPGGARQPTLRRALVAAEVGLAVTLLVGAGLLIRSFQSVVRADRGYQSEHVVGATMFIWKTRPTAALRLRFADDLLRGAAALPGVSAAGLTASPPLAPAVGLDAGPFTIVGRSVPDIQAPIAHLTAMTPGAFDVLGMHPRQGRAFLQTDDSAAVRVAIVNETLARRAWPNESALGKRIRVGYYGPPVEREVVGVVPDTRQVALDAPAQPTIYLPHAQAATGSFWLVVRTALDPSIIERNVRQLVAALDPSLPVASVESFDDIVAESLGPRRFVLLLLGCFAGSALALAVIGVYGVVGQGAVERQRELGVRIALGAQARDILRMVMREGLGAAAVGTLAGLAGAAALSRALSTMLFSVTPFDPVTFGAVALVMLATATLACYLPARRATRSDPLTVLRSS